MTISIDWASGVITVNKVDMVQIQVNPVPIYQLDLDYFRQTLNDLQDDEQGISWPTTHNHNTTVSVGGAILARVVQMINGYSVTFEDDQYAVNLVGANSNVGDVVNVNQVSVRSSNSAGLQDLNSLQAASFAGSVSVNVNSSFSGEIFPVGTRGSPVNNLDDALAIAQNRGIHTIQIMAPMTFDTATDFSAGYLFQGDSPVTVQITLDPAVDIENCEFSNVTVTGTLDGSNSFRSCHIQDVNFFNGAIYECSLNGTITLGGVNKAEIYDSWSGVPGGDAGATATVDLGGGGQDLLMRNYAGGIDLINCSTPANISIDMSSGRVILEPSVSDASFWIRGVADVYDASTGAAVVYDLTVQKGQDDATNTLVAHVWAASD